MRSLGIAAAIVQLLTVGALGCSDDGTLERTADAASDVTTPDVDRPDLSPVDAAVDSPPVDDQTSDRDADSDRDQTSDPDLVSDSGGPPDAELDAAADADAERDSDGFSIADIAGDPHLEVEVEEGCDPPRPDVVLDAVTGLTTSPEFLAVVVSWDSVTSPFAVQYRVYMDGELAGTLEHDPDVDRQGLRIEGIPSSEAHTFRVSWITTWCAESPPSAIVPGASLQRIRLGLGEGTAPAGGTGFIDVLLTATLEVTALSFNVEDSPDVLTVVNVAGAAGWSFSLGGDSGTTISGTYSGAPTVGADMRVATVEVAADSGASGNVRMTVSGTSVSGPSGALTVDLTSDGRFVVTPAD